MSCAALLSICNCQQSLKPHSSHLTLLNVACLPDTAAPTLTLLHALIHACVISGMPFTSAIHEVTEIWSGYTLLLKWDGLYHCLVGVIVDFCQEFIRIIKTWESGLFSLYRSPSPSRESNSVMHDNDDANKVANESWRFNLLFCLIFKIWIWVFFNVDHSPS